MRANAALYTTIATTPGSVYRVSFWALGGDGQVHINAGAGTNFVQPMIPIGSEWTEYTLEFTDNTLAGEALCFTALAPSVDTRVGLDNISVTLVLEPSTYAMLLMAGAGAVWWARRRR